MCINTIHINKKNEKKKIFTHCIFFWSSEFSKNLWFKQNLSRFKQENKKQKDYSK